MAHKHIDPPSPTDQEMTTAPWMKIALQELGKGVAEHDCATEYRKQLNRTLAANSPTGYSLLDWQQLDAQLTERSASLLGPVLMLMDKSNAQIAKYLNTVRTDPSIDQKYRSFRLDPIRKMNTEWRMTAWCAAFVNWCLMQVDETHLGYATAASWLKFGVCLAHPRYGCVAVVAASSDTGSTTGHVAFYGGSTGAYIWLLGGNQSRKVSWKCEKPSKVRGYRWPAIVGDFERTPDNRAIA